MLAKPNALVYVYRNGLIVAGKHITQARLSFPPELIANLEVLNIGKFIERCQQFFVDNNLARKRVLMVLDHSIIFEKKIELDQSGKPDVLAQAFVEAMPFDAGKRACLSIKADDELQLLATNAALYQSIAEALRASSIGKLVAIAPVAAYDLTGTDRKISSLVDRFFKDSEASKQTDFATVEVL